MISVGSYEAKTHLPRLLARVAKGESILITRRGQPVAVLAPAPRRSAREVREVIEEFKAYSQRQGRTLAGLDARQLIDEGRRF
jgi:prevent-host-death family protein